jgi:Rrf2 family protein
MLRFSKKTEYAILATQYLTQNNNRSVSAKEISDNMNISYEFLAKTLQKLMKAGLIRSTQGVKGGYELVKKPEEFTIGEIIDVLEGNISIVECFDDNDILTCGRSDACSIRGSMKKLQGKINNILKTTTLAELSK